jgi:hypothetical protein
MKTTNETWPRGMAIMAGSSLVLMAIVAGLSYGYLHGNLVVANNPAATLSNIQSSQGAFITEILGWTIIFLLDALVAWSLYHFFAPAHRSLAFLSSSLRIAYTAVLGIAIYNLPQVLEIINNQLGETGINTATTEAMNAINAFENVWSKGLIIFGLHLMTAGYLAFISGYVPKIWGVLLLVAGGGYTYLHTMQNFFPHMLDNLMIIESFLTLPMIIGELGFAIWLIAKGGKQNQRAKLEPIHLL